MTHPIVNREAWLRARKALLEEEKEHTRARDKLNELRRRLPWVIVEKPYVFASDSGPKKLGDLFGEHDQLIVYHFMLADGWDAGCKMCSFWADNYDGFSIHLAARNTAFVTVSSAPLDQINRYHKRMGWSFKWVSSHDSEFNSDFGVSFGKRSDDDDSPRYNYGTVDFRGPEAPGISVFYKPSPDVIVHTYSTYARGLDIVNGAYQMMDMLPLGRDEDGLDFPMGWVQRSDEYKHS